MSTPGSRPLSPFMIGPYYRPQLTSMLSITHRATGVFLVLGALLLAWWLYAIAGGPAAYAEYEEFAGGLFGRIVLLAFAFSLVYHFLNGLRHLLWDVGWGLEIPRAYATGWAVMIGSVLGTALVAWCAFGGAA